MCTTDSKTGFTTTFPQANFLAGLGSSFGGSPNKAGADLAAEAEAERQRMALSTKGFAANYKRTGSPEGDTVTPTVRQIVLGK